MLKVSKFWSPLCGAEGSKKQTAISFDPLVLQM